MMEFKAFCEKIRKDHQVKSETFLKDINTCLIDNKWFGIKPSWQGGKMYVDPDEFEPFMKQIISFIKNSDFSEEEKFDEIRRKIAHDLPDTSKKLGRFYKKFDTPEHIQAQVASFILKYVKREVVQLSDFTLSSIINVLCEEETKQVGDSFTTFLSWVRKHYNVRYYRNYVLSKRYERDNNGAYDMDDYLHLIYYLYCPTYIKEHDLYRQAANSKNMADTWLYLSLHLICALRDTDLVRIYHPALKRKPEEILQMVKEGTFPEADARETLYSVTRKLNFLPLRPNKTKRDSGVIDIKFHVPESAEVHIGTLFALAEAHRIIANISDDTPLIRCIKTYDEINRYMGKEIGALFLEGDFRTRSANKSYLQSVFMMTDDILGHEDDFTARGYMIVALARSHKSSYGDFAQTTFTYLKDAKLSGMTPEFVARELFERGVLSCIPSMLLKTLYGEEYQKLSVINQTKLIKELNLSPQDVETTVMVSKKSLKRSSEIVREVFLSADEQQIIKALHRIGYGAAVSKQDGCDCLLTAFGKVCPFDDNRNCVCCDYELSTKATLFLMASEYNRLLTLYQTSESIIEKERCKYLIKTVVLPAMDEMLRAMSEIYGEDTFETLESILKEKLNAA